MIHKQSIEETLAESLKELLKSTPFKKITVKDIVDNCEVTRTTFYRHFKDKYELMNWIYFHKIQGFLDQNPQISKWKDLLYLVTAFLYENQTFFASIVSFNEQNSFREFLYGYGSDYCIAQIRNSLHSEAVPKEEAVAVKIYIDGTIRVLFDWLEAGCPEAPEELARMMCNCWPVPLTKYFQA